ncbi:Fe-S protein assembly co-chaperone HscB [Piscinibacter sp. XHJ-5]|uniref:Fe-S protein assembly co-chaperone HscB n=1 Tax=Piscinibacter sp. XHJ-5 TaxID=3037797 RepID=UPI002452B7E7|nr:Fe-S protein assembly co-chaperone HscB [Piscinibacter sp. XHJ-5]
MKLDSDDFELFGVPRRFEQDRAVLDARWRALQAEVHPDRFAAGGAAAQRVAMQWAVRVNEAYQRLKDPLKRAAYLCELQGAPVDIENNTAMPPEFLMQQMEWREALDEAHSVDDVEALADEVAARKKSGFANLQRTLDEQHDTAAAAEQVRALMFVERFAEDIDHRLEALGQ